MKSQTTGTVVAHHTCSSPDHERRGQLPSEPNWDMCIVFSFSFKIQCITVILPRGDRLQDYKEVLILAEATQFLLQARSEKSIFYSFYVKLIVYLFF